MSGHSKWNNIKRKKEKTDSQRAKIFTRIGREIAVAVKSGGADPSVNSKLRDIIAKAKASNVPNDNIDRIIKKAAGSADGDNYEEIVYEGYGPCGVAVVVETLTDNRNRTAGDLRHFFDKFGGNLGQSGSVMFTFSRKGVILLDGESIPAGKDEDGVLEDALDAGADDFAAVDGGYEIVTDPHSVGTVAGALEAKGYKLLSAEPEYVPATYVTIPDEANLTKMGRLLEALDEDDDVQNVWHSMENELPE